ncbi:hypothetical protein ACN47A_32280, partial [Myxococcus fulvus]
MDAGSGSWIPRPKSAVLVALVVVAGGAAIMAGLRSRRVAPVSPELFLTSAPVRMLEARVSYPGADVYRPYGPLRSAADAGRAAPAPLSELARLEAAGDMHGLAVAYLVRRNAQMAAP